jgi:hypothetical protein
VKEVPVWMIRFLKPPWKTVRKEDIFSGYIKIFNSRKC